MSDKRKYQVERNVDLLAIVEAGSAVEAMTIARALPLGRWIVAAGNFPLTTEHLPTAEIVARYEREVGR